MALVHIHQMNRVNSVVAVLSWQHH